MKFNLLTSVMKTIFTLKFFYCKVITIAILVIFTAVSAAYAGALSLADDLLRVFIKSGSKAVTVSRTAVEEMASKYGDDFVRAARKAGPEAVEIAATRGPKSLPILEKYGSKAVIAMKNYGDDAIRICEKYGDEMTEVMAKSGKIGSETIEKYGKKWLAINRNIPIGVELTAEAVKKCGPGKVEKIINAMAVNGKGVLEYIEKHPKLFNQMLLATAVITVISDEKKMALITNSAKDVTNNVVDNLADTGASMASGAFNAAVNTATGGNETSQLIKTLVISGIMVMAFLTILSVLGINIFKILSVFKKIE